MSYQTPEKIMERAADGVYGDDNPDFLALSGVFHDSQKMLKNAIAENPDDPNLPPMLDSAVQMEKLLIECNDALQAGEIERLEVLSAQVKELGGTDVDVSNDGDPAALEQAIEAGDLLAARQLISSGTDANKPNGEGGLTPLEAAIAVEKYSDEMLRMLLQNGANPNLQTDGGMSPIHLVVGYMHSNPTLAERSVTAQILVKHGADTEVRDKNGWTALAQAVLGGSVDEMQALLMAGSDPNMTFSDTAYPDHIQSKSLLSCAVMYPEKVDMLLDFGADPLGITDDGKAALDMIEIATDTLENTKIGLFKSLMGGRKMQRMQLDALLRSRSLLEDAVAS